MKQLIIPPYLAKGDRIAIVSPSGVIEKEVVMKAAKMLTGEGFDVVIGDNVFNQSGCFAGTDNERLYDLQKATDDHSVKAVFCSRGGYGVSRIIDRVDFTGLRKHPKWYVGFSDITVLHLWLNKICGVISLHAEMPLNYSNPKKTPESFTSVMQALRGEPEAIAWKSSHDADFTVEGAVTGGNLSLIYSLTGTPGEPDTDGTILFIEEVGEYYYHLDRMLTSLRLTGRLRNLAALVVGGMEKIEQGSIIHNKSTEEIVLDIVGHYNYPVLFNFPAGHISDNRAIYIGRKARVTQSGLEASLTWL
ncbi:MAG: LD-carboxypeptidase [Bacteroidales bacterium]|jgi:muramoyltetrapeptide carboxypeptidase|nr:LD-carboxypeptidase [Bacteroidales bacterium]